MWQQLLAKQFSPTLKVLFCSIVETYFELLFRDKEVHTSFKVNACDSTYLIATEMPPLPTDSVLFTLLAVVIRGEHTTISASLASVYDL